MIREHLSSSLGDVFTRFVGWVERRPSWLRPAFYGAGLVYMFMLWRGGLIVLPIAAVWLLFTHPATLFQALPLFLVYVPGAGFLGGLLYGATNPVLGRLGRPGKIVQFILGTWVYCVLLVFFISPFIDRIDPKPSYTASVTENWVISGAMGVLFGSVIGFSATARDTRPNPANDRKFVLWVVGIGIVLIIAMKIAGWW